MFRGAIFQWAIFRVAKKLDQVISILLTLSKYFTCSATFCFAHMEHFWACFEGIYIIIDNKDKLLIIFQQVDVYLSDELKSKLIKNQNYPVNQFKGALVIEKTKIRRVLLFESKRWIGHSKHRNKKKNWKMFCLVF